MPRSRSVRPMRAGLLNLRQEFLPFGFVAHRGSAARRRPHRRDQRSDDQSAAADAVGEPLQVVFAGIDARVRVGEKQIDAVELDAVHRRGGGHVEHRVERDGRLAVGTLADETRPHGVVQCRVFVHLCALVAASSLRHHLRLFGLSPSGFPGPRCARSSDHRRLEYRPIAGSSSTRIESSTERCHESGATRDNTTCATVVASLLGADSDVSLGQTRPRSGRTKSPGAGGSADLCRLEFTDPLRRSSSTVRNTRRLGCAVDYGNTWSLSTTRAPYESGVSARVRSNDTRSMRSPRPGRG